MRKTVSSFAIFACVLTWPVFLAAQQSDSPAVKIAVLNMQVAIASTQAGKQALAELQKKYAPKQQELQTQEKKVEDLQNRLQDQSAMLTSDEQEQLNRQLEDAQRHLKEAQEDDQADFQEDQTSAVRQIAVKMQKLITQYAQQHGYGLVIGEQSIPVYYAAKAIDITQEMVTLYDSTYPSALASTSSNKAPLGTNGDQPKHRD
jgi:outer membrane protein